MCTYIRGGGVVMPLVLYCSQNSSWVLGQINRLVPKSGLCRERNFSRCTKTPQPHLQAAARMFTYTLTILMAIFLVNLEPSLQNIVGCIPRWFTSQQTVTSSSSIAVDLEQLRWSQSTCANRCNRLQVTVRWRCPGVGCHFSVQFK